MLLCHCKEASDEAIWDYEAAFKIDGRDCFVGSLLAMTQAVTRYDLLFATGTALYSVPFEAEWLLIEK